MACFAEPSAFESMFAKERDNFETQRMSTPNVFNAFVGKGSLFLMQGSRHRQERRLIDPLFHGQHLTAYDDVIREVTDRTIDSLRPGRVLPLYGILEEITTRINIRGLIGVTDDERCQRLEELLLGYLGRMGSHPFFRVMAETPLRRALRMVPRRKGRPMTGLKAEIYALLGHEIERCRRQGSEGRDDILSRLVAARDEAGQTEGEANGQICDQLLTFLIAGNSTTSTSLVWTLAHLLERRDIEERVRQELHQVFGNEPADPARNAELEYLNAVIKESLRLHPVFLNVTRQIQAEMSLGGYDLPAGTTIALSIYLLHRRADLWNNPDEFRPDRFLESRPSPFAYCPFGGGPRICVGNSFAMYISRGVLSRLLSRVALRLPAGSKARPELWQPFARPEGGLPVIVDDVAPASQS